MTESPVSLESLLPEMADNAPRQFEVFAFLTLGVLDAIEEGLLSPEAARQRFFNGENCVFTKRALSHAEVDAIMSRGVQLPDLFDALPPDEAEREATNEIAAMRAACLRLLAAQRRVA